MLVKEDGEIIKKREKADKRREMCFCWRLHEREII